MTARKIIEPVPGPETRPFWDAAAEGRFLLRWCNACGKAHWHPREICPLCGSVDTEWRPASGRGVIYSFSVMRRVTPVYAVGYVTLEEGPTMLTELVDCDFDALAIGAPVALTFRASPGGFALPLFRPAA